MAIDPDLRCMIAVNLLLLLQSVHSNINCRLEDCTIRYTDSLKDLESYRDTVEPGDAYCSLLRQYQSCLKTTLRACRGNLQFHSTMTLVKNWVLDNNCTHRPYTPLSMLPKLQTTTTSTTIASETMQEVIPECEPEAILDQNWISEHNHCGQFGDPHLRTFDGRLQTCKAEGAWPLVDNDLIAVQVTNEKVSTPAPATATTKVTVIVRSKMPCTSEKTFEAQGDYLPSTFIDGTMTSGRGNLVYVVVHEPDYHVEIDARHASATVVIRRTGRFLSVAIKLPSILANRQSEGLQLCSGGCPISEQINFRAFPATLAAKRVALVTCLKNKVTGPYLDWCVFDVLTTTDDSFAAAARSAQVDLWNLEPRAARALSNRTTLLPPDPPVLQNGTTRNVLTFWYLKPMFLLTVLYLVIR